MDIDNLDIFDIILESIPIITDKMKVKHTCDILSENDVEMVFKFNGTWFTIKFNSDDVTLRPIDNQNFARRSLSNPVSKGSIKREWNEFITAIQERCRSVFMNKLQREQFEKTPDVFK